MKHAARLILSDGHLMFGDLQKPLKTQESAEGWALLKNSLAVYSWMHSDSNSPPTHPPKVVSVPTGTLGLQSQVSTVNATVRTWNSCLHDDVALDLSHLSIKAPVVL